MRRSGGAVVARLGWIRGKWKSFESRCRQSEREIVTGESHYVQGRRCRLEVVEVPGCHHGVSISGSDMLWLQVQPGTDRDTSFNGLVREYVESIVAREQRRRELQIEELNKLFEESTAIVGPVTWTRDDIHER